MKANKYASIEQINVFLKRHRFSVMPEEDDVLRFKPFPGTPFQLCDDLLFNAFDRHPHEIEKELTDRIHRAIAHDGHSLFPGTEVYLAYDYMDPILHKPRPEGTKAVIIHQLITEGHDGQVGVEFIDGTKRVVNIRHLKKALRGASRRRLFYLPNKQLITFSSKHQRTLFMRCGRPRRTLNERTFPWIQERDGTIVILHRRRSGNAYWTHKTTYIYANGQTHETHPEEKTTC